MLLFFPVGCEQVAATLPIVAAGIVRSMKRSFNPRLVVLAHPQEQLHWMRSRLFVDESVTDSAEQYEIRIGVNILVDYAIAARSVGSLRADVALLSYDCFSVVVGLGHDEKLLALRAAIA